MTDGVHFKRFSRYFHKLRVKFILILKPFPRTRWIIAQSSLNHVQEERKRRKFSLSCVLITILAILNLFMSRSTFPFGKAGWLCARAERLIMEMRRGNSNENSPTPAALEQPKHCSKMKQNKISRIFSVVVVDTFRFRLPFVLYSLLNNFVLRSWHFCVII